MAAHRLNVHIEHSSEVATLRQRTESLVMLRRNEGERNTLYEDHILDLLSGYWMATPEEAAEHWMEMLDTAPAMTSAQLRRQRDILCNDFQCEGFGSPPGKQTWVIGLQRPIFISWNTLENSHGEQCWSNLLAKLRSSKSLINQADGIAFELYTTPPEKEREKLLGDYLDLMERNRQLLTQPQGQALFFAYEPRVRPTLFPPQFAERYASLVETLFAKSSQVDSEILDPIFLMLKVSLGQFRLHTPSGQIFGTTPLLPRENALKVSHAIEDYIRRTTGSLQTNNDRNGLSTTPQDLARTIATAYPGLNVPASSQPASSPLASDGIAIRYIHFRTNGTPTAAQPSRIASIIAACGDRILFKMDSNQQTGFASIDPDCAAAFIPPPPESIFKTPHDIPFPYGHPPVPAKNGFFTVSQYGMLLHYSYQEKKWADETLLFPERLRNTYQEMRAATAPGKHFEYEPPTIGFINNSLYIGTSADGHTIGRVVDGKYELIASSRRKPAEHPLDEVPPSKITALFPDTNGRPCALLTLPDRSEVHDLELRRKIGAFQFHAKACFDGNVPIIGSTYVISALEPSSEKPRNLIRFHSGKDWYERTMQVDSRQQSVWDWPKQISQTDFSMGLVTVGFAAHGDCLFYLKCANSADTHARVALGRPSIAKLTLLCFIPARKEPLEIPLGFQPDAKKNLQMQGAFPSPPLHIHTKYDVERLQATSAGIFFNCIAPKLSEGSSAEPPPSLLCVTWKDVNDWLTHHGHAPIGTRTPALPASPPR